MTERESFRVAGWLAILDRFDVRLGADPQFAEIPREIRRRLILSTLQAAEQLAPEMEVGVEGLMMDFLGLETVPAWADRVGFEAIVASLEDPPWPPA